MRIYFILLLICISIKGSLFSQLTFNNTIDFNNGDETALSIVSVADGCIIGGHGYGNETDDYYQVKLKFVKVDLEGNEVWQHVFADSGYNLYCGNQSGILMQNGNILFCGKRQTDSTSEIITICLDQETGDSIYYKTYDFNDWLFGNQVRELSTGEIIMLAWDTNAPSAYLLLKLSPNGDLIWQKSYGSSNEVYPSNFEIDDEDTIWLINPYSIEVPQRSVVRGVDSSGVLISVNFIEDYCLLQGFKSLNGGFFGAGGYFPIPPYQTYTFRVDNLFTLSWVHESEIDFDTLIYGELFTGAAKELPNGDFISVGYYALNEDYRYNAIVTKIDPFGNTKWEHYYSTPNENTNRRVTCMSLTGDNGILIGGVGHSEFEEEDQNYWILKLDSMGCLIPGCDTIADGIMDLINETTGILIFPNPIAEDAIVQFKYIESINITDLTIEIVDLMGKVVMSREITYFNPIVDGNQIRINFQRNNINAGVYILNIYSNNFRIGSNEVIFK